MNRIYIKYKPCNKTFASQLIIFNDIKGYTCHQVGCPFYGQEADIMLEYFQNAIIKENDKVMNYGIYIEKEDE